MQRGRPELTVGERLAFHRRRRGMTQATLAGLVGRTTSWLEKVESGRSPLDRLSVLRDLVRVLDISLSDLVPDDGPERTQPSALEARGLALSYRAVNPRFAATDGDIPLLPTGELRSLVDDIWRAYQDARFGYVVLRLDRALPMAYRASRELPETRTAMAALAQLYHVAASVLVKVGDLELAQLCADRGDTAAQQADDPIVRASLQRSIAHALLSSGRLSESATVVREGLSEAAGLSGADGASVAGTLLLVGATASARAGERSEAAAFLRHARRLADRLGRDANEVWTSFGPTNVAIHEVTVAAELGDIARAVELGQRLDVTQMPRERRVRHQLEVARALAQIGRLDDAVAELLEAEAGAPEQVRRHFLTGELVRTWMRAARATPPRELVALARRVGHAV